MNGRSTGRDQYEWNNQPRASYGDQSWATPTKNGNGGLRSPQLHLHTPPSKPVRSLNEASALRNGLHQGISLYMNGREPRSSIQDLNDSGVKSPQLNLRARPSKDLANMDQSQTSGVQVSHNIYDQQSTYGSSSLYGSAQKQGIYGGRIRSGANSFNSVENPYGMAEFRQTRDGSVSFQNGREVNGSPLMPNRPIGVNSPQPSPGINQRFSYSSQTNGGMVQNNRAAQVQVELSQVSNRVKHLEKTIAKLRSDYGLEAGMDISTYGLNRLEEKLADNKRELEYFTDAYERIMNENKENCVKLRKLHHADSNYSASNLEGEDELLKQNEKLRNRVKQLKIDLNRKTRQKLEAMEEKAKNQLENEANFLTFRYQSDDDALKHDVNSYYQLLQEINASLKASN